MNRGNPARQLWQVEYPESDGKPMAETDVHRRELMQAVARADDESRACQRAEAEVAQLRRLMGQAGLTVD